MLVGQAQGTQPFNHQAPRYDAYWRDMSACQAPAGVGTGWIRSGGFTMARPTWLADVPSPLARQIWQGLVTVGGFGLTGLFALRGCRHAQHRTGWLRAGEGPLARERWIDGFVFIGWLLRQVIEKDNLLCCVVNGGLAKRMTW